MKLQRQFVLFSLVGSVGFIVDSGVLYFLKEFAGLYVARMVSFTAAVMVTWVLNRNLTFADRNSGRSRSQEFLHYFVLMLIGGAVNFSVYALMISQFSWVYEQPVWGVAGGSLAGLVLNLLSSRLLLYKFVKP